MSITSGETGAPLQNSEAAATPAIVPDSISTYDNEAENWLSRGIGIVLGLAISAAVVGGVVGILHMGGRL